MYPIRDDQMIINKKIMVFVAFVLCILFLFTGTAYAEYYSVSKSCINGCCTSSSEYSEKPYVPDWVMNPTIPEWAQFPTYPGAVYPTIPFSSFCVPYRQGTVGDYLCAGQYHTYCFATTGKRTYMEWILDGGCTPGMAPVVAFNPQLVSWWRQQQCTADFDLYVYQNREPYPPGAADISDTMTGSNAYVGWFDPCEKCYYCVVVYCKQGCGYYYLTTNSYIDMCWAGSGGTGFSPQSVAMYTDTNVQPAIDTEQTETDMPYWVGTPATSPSGTATPSGSEGTFPSTQESQPTEADSEPGYSPQPGATGQNTYSPPTAAGTQPSPTGTGEELTPDEEAWTPQYPISNTNQEDNLHPAQEGWAPQYTPVPTPEMNDNQELKPGEEAWTPMYPYILPVNGTPNLTPVGNVTSNLTPDEEAWTPHYAYLLSPTEKEEDQEKDKNYLEW